MGLLDFTSKVTTTYKADVSDHVKELNKLKGEQKKAAKEEIERQRALQNELENQIKTLGKVTLAVGATVGIAKGAWSAYQHVVEKSRLETQAMGVDITALQQASGGLKTRMDVLRDAALLQQSAFKLTSSQMVSVEKAMLALTRAGFNQEEVTKKVTDAIVKLEGDGLKDFGIRVRSATTDGDKFAAVMEAIEGKARGVNSETVSSAEGVTRLGVRFKDSMNQIETSIGRIVVALGPLIERVGGLLDTIAGAAEGEDNWLGRLSGAYMPAGNVARTIANRTAAKSYFSFEDQDPTLLAEFVRANPDLAAFLGGVRSGRTADAERQAAALAAFAADFDAGVENLSVSGGRGPRRSGGGRRRSATRSEAYSGVVLYDATGGNIGGGGSQGFGADNDSAIDGWDIRQGIGDIAADRTKEAEEIAKRLEDLQRKAADMAAEKKKSFLTAAFGTPEEINLLRDSFGLLSNSVSQALSAWLNGSEEFGAAFKKAIGSGLAALATDYGVKALGELAWGIGTAFTNPAESATHFASAAAYGTAALAAGAGAKLLGAGGGASAPSAGAAGARGAAPTLPAGGAGGITQREHVVVIGNSFADETPRARQLKAERMVNDALGSGGTKYR